VVSGDSERRQCERTGQNKKRFHWDAPSFRP
jgi:hypothetical protein